MRLILVRSERLKPAAWARIGAMLAPGFLLALAREPEEAIPWAVYGSLCLVADLCQRWREKRLVRSLQARGFDVSAHAG